MKTQISNLINNAVIADSDEEGYFVMQDDYRVEVNMGEFLVFELTDDETGDGVLEYMNWKTDTPVRVEVNVDDKFEFGVFKKFEW